MISSGRSFTRRPQLLVVLRARGVVGRGGRARSRRGASSRPGGRCRRSGPGRRCGSPATLRPDACSMSATIALEVVVGELVRGRELDVEDALPRRRRAPRTRRRSRAISPARPFSASRRRKLRDELVGARRASRRGRRPSPASRSPGSRAAACELGHLATAAREVAELAPRTASSRPLSCAASKSARGVDAVRDGYERARSPAGAEVDLGERLVDQPLLVGVGERLARDLLGGEQDQLGDLAPDLVERLRASPGSIWRSVSSRRRCRSSSVSLAHPLALRVRRPCAPPRGSPRPRCAPAPISAWCSSSRPRASSRALSASSTDCRIALAAVVDQLLDRAERVALQHEEGDREADQRPDHQPRDDLDQRVRAEHRDERASPRRGRSRGGRRGGRRTRRPR